MRLRFCPAALAIFLPKMLESAQRTEVRRHPDGDSRSVFDLVGKALGQDPEAVVAAVNEPWVLTRRLYRRQRF